MNNISPVLSKPNPEGILTNRYQQNENIDNSVNNISKLKQLSPKGKLNDNLPRGKLKKDNNNINSPPEKLPTKKEVRGKTVSIIINFVLFLHCSCLHYKTKLATGVMVIIFEGVLEIQHPSVCPFTTLR